MVPEDGGPGKNIEALPTSGGDAVVEVVVVKGRHDSAEAGRLAMS